MRCWIIPFPRRNYDAKLVLVSGAARLGDLRDEVFVWMVFVEWWSPVRLVYTVSGEEGIEDGHGYLEATKNGG
jgi:hypothetical protein